MRAVYCCIKQENPQASLEVLKTRWIVWLVAAGLSEEGPRLASGDDLVNAGLIALGLEEAANGGDDGLGHLRRRRGFGGRVLPRPG